jgi:hypothetical protein
MPSPRIADWMSDPARPADPAHAFAAGDRVPFRGLCGEGRWTIKSVPATAGPLCPACIEVVAGAAFAALEQITELHNAQVPA